MLDALGVAAGDLGADPERAEELLDDAVALAALHGQGLPGLREEDAPIGALLNEAVEAGRKAAEYKRAELVEQDGV